METQALNPDSLDPDGFLNEISGWTRETAHELARRNELGPLNEKHWKILRYLREYYSITKNIPTVFEACKANGIEMGELRDLFPSGYRRGACRIAGLPFLG